jgi:stage III sporulation protein AF
MLETLFEVTRNIVVLLIVFSLLEMLLPRGEFRPFLNMVAGLVLMLTLLAPFWALRQVPESPAMLLTEWPGGQAQEDMRLPGMEQLNQELILLRYRELLAGKIRQVLRKEGFKSVDYTMKIVEEPGHPAYGQLLGVRVLAAAVDAEAAPVRKVPEIQVRLGGENARQQEYNNEVWSAGVPNDKLAALLARELGLAEGKITVRVLKN